MTVQQRLAVRRPTVRLKADRIAVVMATAVGLVAVGLLAGRALKTAPSDPGPRPVRAEHIEFTPPAGWRPGGREVRVPGMDVPGRVTVAPRGAETPAIVAAEVEPGEDGLLPAALSAVLAGPPSDGDAVRVGGMEAVRFRGLEGRAPADMTVYAVPTSGGTAVLACVGSGVEQACDRSAATLRLVGVSPVSIQPARSYAAVLERAFGRLDAARRRGIVALRSADSQKRQGEAADRLSDAYADAAADVRRAPAGRFVSAETARIAAALEEAGQAYQAMGAAAFDGSFSAYRQARADATAAERRASAALAGLEDAGYRIR